MFEQTKSGVRVATFRCREQGSHVPHSNTVDTGIVSQQKVNNLRVS